MKNQLDIIYRKAVYVLLILISIGAGLLGKVHLTTFNLGNTVRVGVWLFIILTLISLPELISLLKEKGERK